MKDDFLLDPSLVNIELNDIIQTRNYYNKLLERESNKLFKKINNKLKIVKNVQNRNIGVHFNKILEIITGYILMRHMDYQDKLNVNKLKSSYGNHIIFDNNQLYLKEKYQRHETSFDSVNVKNLLEFIEDEDLLNKINNLIKYYKVLKERHSKVIDGININYYTRALYHKPLNYLFQNKNKVYHIEYIYLEKYYNDIPKLMVNCKIEDGDGYTSNENINLQSINKLVFVDKVFVREIFNFLANYQKMIDEYHKWADDKKVNLYFEKYIANKDLQKYKDYILKFATMGRL